MPGMLSGTRLSLLSCTPRAGLANAIRTRFGRSDSDCARLQQPTCRYQFTVYEIPSSMTAAWMCPSPGRASTMAARHEGQHFAVSFPSSRQDRKRQASGASLEEGRRRLEAGSFSRRARGPLTRGAEYRCGAPRSCKSVSRKRSRGPGRSEASRRLSHELAASR